MGATGPASGCSTCASATSVSRSRGRGWRRASTRSTASWSSATSRCGRTAGCPTSGSRRATCPASPSRSISRIRASSGSSAAWSSRRRARPRVECMRILRHEAGHAMQHGYRLHRRASYQRMFGKSSTTYPHLVSPQADEPAASCSTCARTTRRHIRTRTSPRPSPSGCSRVRDGGSATRGGGRCRKLEYVDALMEELSGTTAAGAHARARGADLAAHLDAARVLRGEARLLRRRLSEHLRPRALSRLLGRAAAREPRARVALHHAQREGDSRARRALDGRVRVHDRPAAARHDRAQPPTSSFASRAGKGRCCSTSPGCSRCAPCTSSTADGSRFRYERQASPSEPSPPARARPAGDGDEAARRPRVAERAGAARLQDGDRRPHDARRARPRGAGARDQARAGARSARRWRSGSRTSSST